MRSLIRLVAAVLVSASSVAATAQQRIDGPGTVAHGAADAGFPERVGSFERSNVSQYDREGLDSLVAFVSGYRGEGA